MKMAGKVEDPAKVILITRNSLYWFQIGHSLQAHNSEFSMQLCSVLIRHLSLVTYVHLPDSQTLFIQSAAVPQVEPALRLPQVP